MNEEYIEKLNTITKEDLEGKTLRQIDNVIKKKAPEMLEVIKAIREILIKE